MAKDNQEVQYRVIVKKKRGHAGHHGGAWKVAYADFVTAMMALFIVLWIVGQNEKMKANISEYFTDPAKYDEKVKTNKAFPSPIPGPTSSVSPPPPTPTPTSEKTPTIEDLNDELERLKREAEKISKMIGSIPEFKRFKNQIQIIVTNEGLRIELLERSPDEGMFFDLGSAKLKPEAVKLLKMLAKEVGKLPNRVTVEGHTDAKPYSSSNYYSNWELSTDRANSARKVLSEGGLKKKQIDEIRGYADMRLRLPNNPNDYSNRRVTILIKTRMKSLEAKNYQINYQDQKSQKDNPGPPPTILPEAVETPKPSQH